MNVRRQYGKHWDGEKPFLQFLGADGAHLGTIWLREGVFSFEGDAAESMHVFMEAMNQHNEYMVPRGDLDDALLALAKVQTELDELRNTKGAST